MTSLITGNRGFVGRHLDRYLRNVHFVQTVGFDMLGDYPTTEVLVDFLKSNSVDDVYHLGARPFIPDCYGMSMDKVVNSNITFTVNLLLACKKAGVKRMVYMSTSEVYGNQDLPINENTPVNPLSTYAATKLAAENLVRTFRDETGFDARILRHFNIYGPEDTHPRIIPKLMSAAKHNKTIKLGNIDITRDFSYVSDACEALYNVMNFKYPTDFIRGEGSEWSIEDLISVINDLYKTEISYEVDSSLLRPNEVYRLKSDSNKYERSFPNHRPIKVIDGLKLTKEWYDQNDWDWECRKD